MPKYSILVTSSAAKEITKLPIKVAEIIVEAIKVLETNPYPSNCKKLVGSKNYWRLRVGDYRIIYEIENKIVTIKIITVRHRKDAYK